MRKDITEKDKIISSVKEFSENLVIKNCALGKENKRFKLALKQSGYEKRKTED